MVENLSFDKNSHDANLKLNETASAFARNEKQKWSQRAKAGAKWDGWGISGFVFQDTLGEREGGRWDVIIEIENNIKLTLPSFSFSVW